MSDTEKFLVWFTKREDALMAKVKEKKLTLPERLREWRFWIGDPVIYISELSIFVG